MYAITKCQEFSMNIGAGIKARTDCNAKGAVCNIDCGQFSNEVSGNTGGGMASPTNQKTTIRTNVKTPVLTAMELTTHAVSGKTSLMLVELSRTRPFGNL